MGRMIQKGVSRIKKNRGLLLGIIVIELVIMFFLYSGVFKQFYIVSYVQSRGVFDPGNSRKEWTSKYRRDPFAMVDKPWSLDREKLNNALEEFNKHSSMTSKEFSDTQQSKQEKGKTLNVEDSFQGLQTTYMKLTTDLSYEDKVTKKYIRRIATAVSTADKNEGIIIDLRDHTGGKYFTSLTGFSGLLENDTPLLYTLVGPKEKVKPFKIEYETYDGKKQYIVNGLDSNFQKRINKRNDVKVAVLIGPKTSSAAEILTLALSSNRKQVRTFGENSSGYTSTNNGMIGIPRLNITCGWLQSTDGTVYKNDPISPDVKGIDLVEIKKWIYSN